MTKAARWDTGEVSASWRALSDFLRDQESPVTLTWTRLSEIVGALPASATSHRAWWSGDRPHVHAWRSAGFRLAQLEPGQSVTFVRDAEPKLATGDHNSHSTRPTLRVPMSPGISPAVLLVTCVKSKRSTPSAAKDLYTSQLFLKQRAYAEAAGLPWFILSAEHGLVAPDEWLAPYERYLPDTPSSYREAWGRWVVARLELLHGTLAGATVEVHASDAYISAVEAPLRAASATIHVPLAGLALGERLQWYAAELASDAGSLSVSRNSDAALRDVESLVDQLAAYLSDEGNAVTVPELLASGRKPLQRPGLYSWWVDDQGARDLALALGQPLDRGLIYAGQAGATRWPSGRRSSNTLWARLAGMHLGKKHEFSTFRRTLASLLGPTDSNGSVDELALTAWMTQRLRVIAAPADDADVLGAVEHGVLQLLDPPLNLKGMGASAVRERLKQARRPLRGKRTARGEA